MITVDKEFIHCIDVIKEDGGFTFSAYETSKQIYTTVKSFKIKGLQNCFFTLNNLCRYKLTYEKTNKPVSFKEYETVYKFMEEYFPNLKCIEDKYSFCCPHFEIITHVNNCIKNKTQLNYDILNGDTFIKSIILSKLAELDFNDATLFKFNDNKLMFYLQLNDPSKYKCVNDFLLIDPSTNEIAYNVEKIKEILNKCITDKSTFFLPNGETVNKANIYYNVQNSTNENALRLLKASGNLKVMSSIQLANLLIGYLNSRFDINKSCLNQDPLLQYVKTKLNDKVNHFLQQVN